MDFSTNDDFANCELSTGELDTISAGLRITLPFIPIGPTLPVPQGGMPSRGQGGDVGRPHPGVPPYEVF